MTTISPFMIEDYDEVFSLWRQCEGIGLSDSDSRENIQLYLKRNPGLSFGARGEGRIIGAVLAGHDGRRGYIHHLAVHPDRRRQGVGKKLVDRSLSALKEGGILKCHLFIFNTNTEGLAFWKSTGWELREDISVVSRNLESGDRALC
jgi:N-acetylglutamate synthase